MTSQVTFEKARSFLPEGIPMDPYFSPEKSHCSEEHVRRMLQGPWPIMHTLKQCIVGQPSYITYTVLGLFGVGDRDIGYIGKGHVWLIDYFGKGKTLLAKIPAEIIGATSSRIQGGPDMLPADILGNRIIDFDDSGKRYFRLIVGPAFAAIQLYDEINRFSPRALAALLEVLGEGTITIAGETHKVAPFAILTSNPAETEGVYITPPALDDRIQFQIRGAEFTAEIFTQIMRKTRSFFELKLPKMCDMKDIEETRRFFHETIYVSPEVDSFIGEIIERLNNASKYSPFIRRLEDEIEGRVLHSCLQGRGSVHLEGAARTLAAFRYRDFVTPSDYYKVFLPVVRHRAMFAPNVLPYLMAVWRHRDALETKDHILNNLLQEVWNVSV